MHGSRRKILSQNLVRRCCAEEFNSGVKGLMIIDMKNVQFYMATPGNHTEGPDL
jgi:hypothetical protein